MEVGTTGVWAGTLFTPTASDGTSITSPMTLFAPRRINTSDNSREIKRHVLRRRFVPRIGGLKTMLLITDGACLDIGSTDREPRGGWAFIFTDGPAGVVKGTLEQNGPDKEPYPATCHRAELRAVLAAMEFRKWWGEGWERVVVAADSEYVVSGATKWLRA